MSSTAVTLKGYIALQQSNTLNKIDIRDFEYVNLGSVCFCTLYLIFPFYKTNTKTIENHSQPVCKFVFFAYVFETHVDSILKFRFWKACVKSGCLGFSVCGYQSAILMSFDFELKSFY